SPIRTIAAKCFHCLEGFSISNHLILVRWNRESALLPSAGMSSPRPVKFDLSRGNPDTCRESPKGVQLPSFCYTQYKAEISARQPCRVFRFPTETGTRAEFNPRFQQSRGGG